MARIEKYTLGAMGNMLAHYDRSKASSTSKIDPKYTHLNYNMASSDQPLPQLDFIHKRLSEIKVLKRADVNIFCTWLVTAPRELNPNEYNLFFKESYDFLCNRYGKENVISAYVHNDETQPHIHFAFIPVSIDKKKNIPKLSAKEVVTRTELKSFHKDLSGYMKNIFKRDIGILNGNTDGGNLTISELRKRSENAMRLDNTILKDKADELQHNKNKKIFKSDSITLSEDEFLETRKTLQEAVSVIASIESINAENKNNKKEADRFYEKAKEKLSFAEAQANEIVNKAESESERKLEMISEMQKENEQILQNNKIKEKELYEREKTLNERSDIIARDKKIKFLENEISEKNKELEKANSVINEKTNTISKLNKTLSEKESENEIAIACARSEIEKELINHYEAIIKNANNKISELTQKVERAFKAIHNICISIAKLGYVQDDKYLANLNVHQYHLLDAVLNFGSRLSKENGYEKNAEEIDKTAGIAKEIQYEMDKIEYNEEKNSQNLEIKDSFDI